MGSTNYFNTFIGVAEDCRAEAGETPPLRGSSKSVANLQFEMLHDEPYTYTSDDVLFAVYATRQEIPAEEWPEKREAFFAKGQPCFRASPLTKRYGWGIHSDEEGKIALVGVETEVYRRFVEDETVTKTKAMQSKRA